MRRLFVVACVLAVWSGILRSQQDSAGIRVIAFGDVNLGRHVGQVILSGDTTYPFRKIGGMLRSADLCFVNLESVLSEQHGETQSPRSNLIFCGPPAGAWSLSWAGVDVVATANNHAFDYGLTAVEETRRGLDSVGIAAVGTASRGESPWTPVVRTIGGIRIGFVAFTEFMNFKGDWKDAVAVFDTSLAGPVLRALKGTTDFVVASYHGGDEYVDTPTRRARDNMRWLSAQGANIVLGHHPHVLQGYERTGGRWIFWSLGNCVFYQPQKFWTQLGLGVQWTLRRSGDSVRIASMDLLPVRAGYQPDPALSPADRDSILHRLDQLTTTSHHFLGSVIPLEVP